jgi:hypothetical protein
MLMAEAGELNRFGSRIRPSLVRSRPAEPYGYFSERREKVKTADVRLASANNLTLAFPKRGFR